MRAVTWQGTQKVTVEDVPDPRIEAPTDAIVRITSTAICGSDLHLYQVLSPFMHAGDILGHEPMGIVEEVGAGVTNLAPGDRVVIPFNISCGSCFMCDRQLYSQCETTQVTEFGKGASLFGYTEMYGQVPGGQAELLRVPHADFGPIKVPDGPIDDRFLYLSDILPTAWQAVKYADPEPGGTLAVLGVGPVGQFAVRSAKVATEADQVIAVDLVPERLALAAKHGATTIDLREVDDVGDAIRELTDGRGADAVVDAVGMEAHGNSTAKWMQKMTAVLPDAISKPMTEKMGIDRLSALYTAIDACRRGGTVSLSGVYGGAADPLPMLDLFDKQLQVRMGQCNVRKWTDEILPYCTDDADPLGTEDLVTHRVPLADAPGMYETFQSKDDGCIKVVLDPAA
ncbi:glutathione-dependent formaldehyde dehydrogenase [Nitriliruptoraceae bacterium ZYF776]|nr:glutathione-dependent formaldehyde dehydrogenase [Profundirhabdus halotolerans]